MCQLHLTREGSNEACYRGGKQGSFGGFEGGCVLAPFARAVGRAAGRQRKVSRLVLAQDRLLPWSQQAGRSPKVRRTIQNSQGQKECLDAFRMQPVR